MALQRLFGAADMFQTWLSEHVCVCLSMYRCASAYVCRMVSALCQCVHPQRPGGVHGQREWEERRRVDVNPQRPLLVFSG